MFWTCREVSIYLNVAYEEFFNFGVSRKLEDMSVSPILNEIIPGDVRSFVAGSSDFDDGVFGVGDGEKGRHLGVYVSMSRETIPVFGICGSFVR